MNNQKVHRLIPLLLLLAVSMAVFAAGAGDQAAEPARTAKSPENTEQTSPASGEVKTETPESVEKAGSAKTAAPRSIKEFKPTEKIQADSAVSFPIDI